jgi:hypothetical protein
MAIAVIGGLVTSTALTLVMVPAAFTWIDDFEHWLARRLHLHFGNTSPSQSEAPAAPPAQAQA